jgi:hypothetical protein
MLPLLMAFWSVTRLRRGPQDFPASVYLLGVVLAAHWLLGVLLGLFSIPLGEALVSALLGTLTLVAVVHGLLLVRRKPQRSVQALIALGGAEVVIGLAAIPIYGWAPIAPDAALPALLTLGLIGWNYAVAAHVLRRALDITAPASYLVAAGYIIFSMALAQSIAPPAVT